MLASDPKLDCIFPALLLLAILLFKPGQRLNSELGIHIHRNNNHSKTNSTSNSKLNSKCKQ